MTVFPTAYFGSIKYFQELMRSIDPVIEVNEHFIKQTTRTRCMILGANGVQNLSIPVIRPAGSKTPMKDVTISGTENWQKIHWKSIESAYANAPYFEAYDLEIKDLIFNSEKSLIKFNERVTLEILSLLDLNLEFSFSDDFSPINSDFDWRTYDFEKTSDIRPYVQVFSENGAFHDNLSILDLLFCEGPMARNWILNSQ